MTATGLVEPVDVGAPLGAGFGDGVRDVVDDQHRPLGEPWAVGREAPSAVPALLIGRLATDRRVAGQGPGTHLVRHILATAVELNVKAACHVVVVTAIDDGAYRWWQRFGFVPDTDDATNLDLQLSKDIAVTFRWT